jgi:hypothetical protein
MTLMTLWAYYYYYIKSSMSVKKYVLIINAFYIKTEEMLTSDF